METRLYDRMKMHAPDKIKVKGFERAQVIVADNVVEYFYAINRKEVWDLRYDYPNLAPPFEYMFIEAKRPSKIVSETHGEVPWDLSHRPSCWGMFIEAERIPPGYDIAAAAIGARFPRLKNDPYAIAVDAMLRHISPKGGWACIGTLFMEGKWADVTGSGPEVCWTWVWAVDHDGKLACPPRMEGIGKDIWGWISVPQGPALDLVARLRAVPEAYLALHPLNPTDAVPSESAIADEMSSYARALLLTLSFMHCKNVERVRSAPPPHRLQKARQERGKPPLCRYYTLKVDRAVPAAPRPGASTGEGSRKSFHIVRGHFKTFTKERPLLGKHVGTYWWPMHVAGSKATGVVAKDYEVVP